MKGNKTNIEDLSDFILMYFIKNNISINHLKLQKILYYIQAWHLVYFEENPLFDEIPEAWVNGPVYRSIYDKLKELGVYNNIGLIETYEKEIDSEFINVKTKLKLTEEQFQFLDAIFQHYGLMNHEKLVFMTHSELPWNQAREGLGAFEYSDKKISHELMCEYYKNRLETKSN